MTPDEARAFVRDNHQAVLATFRRDGRPQLSPVAAGIDDEGRVEISSRETAMKVKNLRRDPRISLCLLGPHWYGSGARSRGPPRSSTSRRRWTCWSTTTAGSPASTRTGTSTAQAMEREKRVLVRFAIERAGPTVAG